MIRLSSSTENFLNTLTSLRERFDQLQRQLSSGVGVERASDAPERVGDLVRVKAEISGTDQILANLGQVQAEVDTGERALERGVRVIEEAIVIASQAGSDAATVSQKDTFAAQVRELHDEMVTLSRTTDGGRYVFAGDADGTPPYEINLANPNGVNRLTTASATREVETSDGRRFIASRTATEIFDHRDGTGAIASDNAFAALNTLAAAIEAGDGAAIDAALLDLRAAGDHLNSQLAFYGRVQVRIESASGQASKALVNKQQRRSALEDADAAAAAVELSQVETNLQAAMQARSAFQLSNLFDFLRR